MGILTWQKQSNIENSIKKYIDAQILAQSLQLLNQEGVAKTVSCEVGQKVNNNWNLPVIQVYTDSKTSTRLEIGSNNRLKDYLVIIECRTLLSGQERNLGEWLEDTLNNGVTYYEYSVTVGDPSNPTETDSGHVRIDFISSNPVSLGDDVDLFDKYRYRTTLRCSIS